MQNKFMEIITSQNLKATNVEYNVGDTLRINYVVKEGSENKERLQAFEGTLIGVRGAGLSKMMRVRKISNGIGVERIIPINSPYINSIEVVRRGKVNKAKLYYLRDKIGKAARVKELRY